MGQCGVIVFNSSTCPTNFTPQVTSVVQPSAFAMVVELYIIGLLCLVGLVGNIMSLLVLRFDKERREALFLLQALAIADCLYLAAAIVRHPLEHLLPDSNQYHAMQPYVFPLLKTFQTITIWMMVVVTIDRFIYVCKPLRAHNLLQDNRRVRRLMAVFVFVVGAMYNLPRFFELCATTFHNLCTNTSTTRMVPRTLFNNHLYYDIYRHGMYILFLYLGPLSILCFMNIRLIQAINSSRRRHRDMVLQTGTENNHENNATLVLVIIVLAFIACETPELILRVLTIVQRRSTTSRYSSLDVRFANFNVVSELLMVINSSINFFIYFIFGKRFRQVFKETFVYKFSANTTMVTHELLPLQCRGVGAQNHVVRIQC